MKVMKSFMLALIVTSLSFSGCLNSSVENESAGSNSEETLITVTTNEAVSCELLAKGASYSVNGLTTVESSYNGCSNPNMSGLPTLISNLAIGDVVILSIDNDLACKVVITEMNLVLKGALCNINIDPKCPEKNWELGSPNPSWHGNQEPKLMHSYSPNEFWFVDYSTCDLSSFDLSNTNFGPSNFSYTNLTGANLENSDLSKVKLEHSKVTFIRGCPAKLPSQWSCEFQYNSGGDADSLAFHFLLGPKSNLSGLNAYTDNSRNYQGRNLSGINLSDSRIGTSTEPWNLANANLENANFSNSDAVLELSFANLTNATFVGAILDGKINNADISVTDFQEAVHFSMDGRNLINCSNELLPADVKCANTTNFGLVLLGSRMNLSRIDLVPGQNFGYVNLEYSDLSYTNFTDAGLSNAVLYNTNFYGSNLSGTMFPDLGTSFPIPNYWVWAIELEACPILSVSYGDAYCLNNNIISPYAHSYLANLSNLDLTGIQLRVDHIDNNPYSPFFSSGWGEFPDGYDFALVNWENTICPDGTNSSDNVDLWGLGISPICTLENM